MNCYGSVTPSFILRPAAKSSTTRAAGPYTKLFAAEEENDFDNQDDDDGEFEDETAGLVELVHHEAIELAGRAEFLLDQTAVIGNAHFGRNQVVEAGIEHIAEEFDGVVDFFRKLHDVEANGIDARGLSREAPIAEAAALVFKETIDAVEHIGEQTVVVAKFKKLGV